MRTRSPPLPAFEVAVRRRSHTLLGGGDIGVHAEAHRAAGAPPVKPGTPEDLIEAFTLGLRFDLLRARHDHRIDAVGDLVAVEHLGRGAQIPNPRVGARADEDAVELDLVHRNAWLESHVVERATVLVRVRLGHGIGDRDHHARRRAPGDHRADRRCIDHKLAIKARARFGVQTPPPLGDLRGGSRPAAYPLECRVIGRDHAGAAASFDRHVADSHAALHRERLDRGSRVLDDVARSAVDANLPDRVEDQVLGRDAEAERGLVEDPHRARL